MIKVEVSTQELARRLLGLASHVRNRGTANRLLAAQLQAWVLQNFATEGGKTERGFWAPLAPSTREWKRRHGYAMILQNTGQLRNSFLPFSDASRAGVGARIRLSRKRPGNLAAIHQYGTARIPARPMLPTARQALEIGLNVYGFWIQKGRAQAKL